MRYLTFNIIIFMDLVNFCFSEYDGGIRCHKVETGATDDLTSLTGTGVLVWTSTQANRFIGNRWDDNHFGYERSFLKSSITSKDGVRFNTLSNTNTCLHDWMLWHEVRSTLRNVSRLLSKLHSLAFVHIPFPLEIFFWHQRSCHFGMLKLYKLMCMFFLLYY